MHQRLMNSSAKPESGPECSVPATGCAGTKCTLAGKCGAMSRTTAPLTEPTSETIAPGFRWAAISCATGPQAPTGMQRITRSASFYGLGIGLDHAVDDAEFLDPRAGLRRARGGDDFVRQPLLARGARDRAADQPEADQRDLA